MGLLLCRADSSSIRKGTSSHHGWSYDLADALVAVLKGSGRPELLGAVAWHRGTMSDHDDQGTVVVGGVHERELQDNWKPAPRELGQSPYVRSRSSAAALCLGGVAERSQS
ncbi:hypothetical protein AB0I84_28930 [Streptomyces spectabilis]|uniref:hypothetical protein n=1 Tax=Streptomyces spectabilis TaxID=68270 RepID=UPI0033EA13D6